MWRWLLGLGYLVAMAVGAVVGGLLGYVLALPDCSALGGWDRVDCEGYGGMGAMLLAGPMGGIIGMVVALIAFHIIIGKRPWAFVGSFALIIALVAMLGNAWSEMGVSAIEVWTTGLAVFFS